jgi:hypothetical protein
VQSIDDVMAVVFAVVSIIIISISVFLGFSAGADCAIKDYRKQAIDRGFAEYDSVTGDWKWKDKILK